MANLEERRYTPGKPCPNHVEFLAAVGSDDWLSNMVWTDDTQKKYGKPEKKLDQIQTYINYFAALHGKPRQPHIFYIDARWGSPKLMLLLDQAHLYGVLSCSAKSAPQPLFPWMRDDLEKGQWRVVGYPPAHANLVTIHTKKKVYLNIITNYAQVAATVMEKKRRKFPAKTYTVSAPWAQKNYNEFKCKVDQWNKAVRAYARVCRYTNSKVMYTQFFIHAFVLQSWTYWKATTGNSIPQLDYRMQLLEEILMHIKTRQLPPPLPTESFHWPVQMKGQEKKCQYPPCRNKCTLRCPACDKWGCRACLEQAHQKFM